MKTRKSTAILISVWIATLVLYLFVKPEGPDNPGYTPMVNTMLSNYLPGAPDSSPR